MTKERAEQIRQKVHDKANKYYVKCRGSETAHESTLKTFEFYDDLLEIVEFYLSNFPEEGS